MSYLSLKSLAEYTSLSTRTLRHWINDPEDPLPAYRVGGKLLFKWSEVERWIKRHRVTDVETNTSLNDIATQALSSLEEERTND